MKRLNIYILVFLIITFLSACLAIKSTSIKQEQFLGQKNNSTDIYTTTLNSSFFPMFNADPFPMEKLLLINIKDDPYYYQFEIQQFDDEFRKGNWIIAYDNNSKADIYFNQGFFIKGDASNASPLLNSPTFIETNLKSSFIIGESGVSVYVMFKDKYNRVIEFIIKENNYSKKDAMLAPVGKMSTNPSFFPFIYLEDFRIVPNKNLLLWFKIDEKSIKIKKLPFLFVGEDIYFIRYSDHPVIVFWLNNERTIVDPVSKDETLTVHRGITYEIQNNGDHFEIRSISCNYKDNRQRFIFSPPIPNIVDLKNDIQINGNFSTENNNYSGVWGGNYSISKRNGKIVMKINPSKGWQPSPGRLWLTTYYWEGTFILLDNNLLSISSSWVRTK